MEYFQWNWSETVEEQQKFLYDPPLNFSYKHTGYTDKWRRLLMKQHAR